MIKPISTWTQTFYKLGYTLRRVWRDETDCGDNYTPLAIEVLEERQMLSGFGGPGGDDPMGGGTGGSDGSGGDAGEFGNTPGSGGGALAGGANDITGVTDARPGVGYTEQAALSLSQHWRADSNASYAWNQGPVLLSYFGTRTSGTTTGVNYHAEVSEFDEDLGTYLISFYTYNYTITVSRSSDAATGGMGGFGTPNSAEWYKEHLVVTVGGFTIETDNHLIANDFLDNGQFDNFNSATFKQIGTHSGTANYTFTGTLSSITPNSYSRIDIILNEQFQQSFNYQTTVDSFWDRDGLSGELTIAGSVQVSGGSQSNRHTAYDSSTVSTGRNFNVTGNSSGSSNQTITYQNASLTVATTGFVPADVSAAAGANLHPTNPDGTYVALPTEGSRHQLKLHGTQTSTATSSSNFAGNGTIQFQGSNAVRTGIVNYSASADATQTNDYVRTYTSDQTILGATILYGLAMAPNGSLNLQRKIEKGASQEIDIAVLHSHTQTTDKNRSESELRYNLKHEYTGDGKVNQTTQAVNSLTGLGLSFYRLRDDFNTETQYRQIEKLQFTKALDNSTEFRRTDGTIKVTGPETRLTTFATSTTSAQAGFTHETVSTGQVFVTGTTDLTQTSNQTSINSFKSRKYESQLASATIELTLDGSGNVESPPPMAGWRDSSSHAESTVASTQRLHDSILRHWNFAATGVVTIADNSTYRGYTTAYSSSFERSIATSLNATDGQGNTHSDAFEQTIRNTTTAYGLGSLTDRQQYWLSGEGATIAAAAVGEASVIIQSLVITFTPRPTPTNNDDEDDVEAVASGSSDEDKYDRTQSGTSRQIRLGGYFDTGSYEGFARVSGQTLTPAGATTPAITATHFNRDYWNKTTGGDSTYSLTDLFSFNADNSFSIHSTGWSEDMAEDDGEIGYRTTLGSKSGHVGQGPAMSAITAEGQTVATDSQWDALANQMNDDGFTGFAADFSLSRLIDTRDSSETASDRVRTEYNLTRTFTPTTFEVPADSSDDSGDSGDGSNANTTASDSESETGETRTVEGYEITTIGSATVVATSSYAIQPTAGQTELLYARQQSSGTYEYVPGQGFGTGPSYRWMSNGRSITELAGEGNSASYSSSTTVITSYLSDGLITIQTISDIDGDTESLATAKTTTSDRLWQDDYTAGHGRIAAARSSSLPPNGPNLSSSSSYRYDSSLTLTIDPSLFPPPSAADDSSDSSGTYDENGGQSNYTPGSGTSGSGTSGSGTSTNLDGSGSSNPGGSTGPTLAEQYQNMQYGVSRWDAADKGFDLTGTVTETSDSNFSHREQLSQSSEDLMRMDEGRKVGAVKFNASSLEEVTRAAEGEFQVTHNVGSGFTINKAEDEVQTNHNWMDKQISSRSEHREYAAPTAAPPTTMAALRTSSPGSTQSLLGDAPAGSSLQTSSTHTTTYYSPLSDVTKTVKNWIETYTSDGSPNAEPILYRHSDEVNVNVTAWVEKIGDVFNGSSTLRSKSTFTESDQGTIETYRGLERQEPNSFNNWTVTYVPIETLTGGITQSITHTKPAADNTITIPNQGTNTTVEPGGEYHSGTTTLSTYLTVQKPLADFVGEFSTRAGYVSTSATTPSNGGSSEGDYSQTSGGSGAQDGGAAASVSLGDLPNLSDEELENTIKLFFYMHEGLTPEFAAFQAMSKGGFIQVSFYRSPSYFFDTQWGTSSRKAKTGETIWTIHLDRNEIEENGLAWAVGEFRKRLESLNSSQSGDLTFRSKRALFADAINAASLSATPSAANSAAQDAYFYRLSNEKAEALAAAAVEAEAALKELGDNGELIIRLTPQGGLVLAVVDLANNEISWQSKVIGLGGAAVGMGGYIKLLRAAGPIVKTADTVEDLHGFANSGLRNRKLFGKVTEFGDSTLPAGTGGTDKFGNVVYSTLGTTDDINLVRYHESVHSFLSPKFELFRELRADIGMTAYSKSSFLRYLEEALAESYAQLRVNGLRGLPTGMKFPISNGYVTIQAVFAEGAIGTIVIGGVVYYVFYDVE